MVLQNADLPLAPPLIAGEMMVDEMTAGRFGYRRLQGLNFVQRQNKKSGKIHLFNLTFYTFIMNKCNIYVSNTQGRYLRRFFIISKNVINF